MVIRQRDGPNGIAAAGRIEKSAHFHKLRQLKSRGVVDNSTNHETRWFYSIKRIGARRTDL